jgi:hypothetical protein
MHIMKKRIFIPFLLLLFGALNAQTTHEEIDYIQAMFGMEKRAAVKEFIVLKENEAKAFWKYYDEYEIQRKIYGKERIILLDKFAEQYDSMTDEESISWMESVMTLRNNNEKLIEKYYKKILKECSPIIAMQFYQIESYIPAGIRFQILENVPF